MQRKAPHWSEGVPPQLLSDLISQLYDVSVHDLATDVCIFFQRVGFDLSLLDEKAGLSYTVSRCAANRVLY